MKKTLFFLAAISAFAACSKTEAFKSDQATPISINVPYPAIATDTKIAYQSGSTTKLQWESTDQLKLVVQNAIPATTKNYTDCGVLTTTGGKTATFTGTIPADAVSTKYGLALFPASAFVEFGYSSITGVGYYSKMVANIPVEQDGTGLRYMIGVYKFKDGALSNFTWATTMTKITVPGGKGIYKVKFSQQEKPAAAFSGEVNIYFKEDDGTKASATTSQGTNKGYDVTVGNGSELSGEIFFTTRGLTSGEYFILEFFDNAGNLITLKDGKTKLKKTASGSVGNGRIINFGDVSSFFN